MSVDFSKSGITDLPYGFSRFAIERFGAGDTSQILAELGDGDSYERVGVDRAMAIAIDLAVVCERRQATILDIGCSLGTIGLLLSSIGYRVTGIDGDVDAPVQDWLDESSLRATRSANAAGSFELVKADLRDFLATNRAEFDVALLLNDVHHWLGGYGYTGRARFDRVSVRQTLLELCSRVRDYIYLETPIDDKRIEMSPDPEGEFVLPRWFLEAGQATDLTPIASTVAKNGKPGRLYRIEMD